MSFSSVVDALEQKEAARRAREARMENALGILANVADAPGLGRASLARFVRATAREGLGRDG